MASSLQCISLVSTFWLFVRPPEYDESQRWILRHFLGLPKKEKTVSTRHSAFILKSEWEKTRGKVMITSCFDHLCFSLYNIMLNWFVDQEVSEHVTRSGDFIEDEVRCRPGRIKRKCLDDRIRK